MCSPKWTLTSSIGHCGPGSDLSRRASITATVTRHRWAPSVGPMESPTSRPASLAAPNQWVKQLTPLKWPPWTRESSYIHSYVQTHIYTHTLHQSWFIYFLIPFLSHFLSLCQNLTSCSCISSTSEEAVALPGKCPSPGCQQAFLTFLCVIDHQLCLLFKRTIMFLIHGFPNKCHKEDYIKKHFLNGFGQKTYLWHNQYG